MAQSGYTPILIYASGTATNVPLAANMTSSASGAELALNYADGKLYFKNSSGTVTLLAGSGGGGPAAGSNTQVQFNNGGVFGASSSLTWASNTLTTQNLALTGNVTSNLLFTDNTYDIGASGATRPRNLFLAGTATIASTLTAGAAVTFDTVGAAINIGTSQTTGTLTLGGTAQTAAQTFGQSTKTHSLSIGVGATESGATKTISFGTSGVSGSTTNITIGSTAANASSVAIYKYLSIGAAVQTAYGLDIQTDIGPQIRSLRADNTSDAEAYHFQFARGNGTGNVITMTTTADGSNGVKKLLWLNSATGSYPLAVTKDGYAGINNSTPANWLHVIGTNISGRGQFTVQSSASNVNPRMTWYYGGATPSYTLDIYGDTTNSFAQYDTPTGYGQRWSVNGSTKLQLNTNAILAMNGATADSWSTFTSGGILQLDDGNYVTGLTGNSTQIGSNGYFNGNWIYKAAAPAANINIDTSGVTNGIIYMRTAPTGTAGGNLSTAWNYNLTMFSNGSGTTGTNSFGDPGQDDYPLYITGAHVSGYGGVFYSSPDTAYFCARTTGATDGLGLRLLSSANVERARLSIEPSAGLFDFFVNDNVPIKFSTNATSRWTIDNSATSGSLIAQTANIGIKFNKSGALNNQTLNDYEYGTWTPTIGGATGSDFTMTEQQGLYTKVGRIVTVIGIFAYSSKASATASAQCVVKGLPFATNSDVNNSRAIGTFGISPPTTTNWYSLWLYTGGGITYLGISGTQSLTAGSVDTLVSDMASTGTIRFTSTYIAD